MSHPTTQFARPHKPSWLDTPNVDRKISRVQRYLYWILRALGIFMVRSQRIAIVPSDLVHGTRYVIASNHQSMLDPFFISSRVPHNTWKHLGTIHYFTANYFINLPVLGNLLLHAGCFPAKVHSHLPYGMPYATQELKAGQTIMIFPEGRRTIRGESRIRNGVALLAQEPHAMIVPTHIEWEHTRFGRKFRIGIGKPFDGSKLTADEIMDRIYSIPVK